jgi:molybdopterin converting factor small subunit
LWRQFDLREPSERAAYWVALKAICADELPKRGYRGRGAVRGGAHASSLARGRAVRMALNQNLSDEAAALADGAEVAFFPPVTGG